jgi:hypothetical protein
MNIRIKLITIIIVLFAGALSAQPKLTLNATFGYGLPLGDFKTDIPTNERADADYFPYYTKQLINFGAEGKLAIGKKGNFRVVFGGTFNIFSNSTDAMFFADPGKIATEKVNPFVGAGFAANFFSGSFDFGGTSVYVKGAQRTGPMDMKAETRIGIYFDGGVDFMLSKHVGAVVGLRYHLINPIGKGSDVAEEIGPNEIDLADQERTEDGTTFSARNISSFNGYVGVSFYFGAPKPKMKK